MQIIEAGGVPIKAWTDGVMFEDSARRQVENVSRLPIIHKWVSIMPDVHWGIGATIGSVIPTINAIIPAAVGVDIGCGMMAVQASLNASDLPDSLSQIRSTIERAVPHGRTSRGGRGDRGSWKNAPHRVMSEWSQLSDGYEHIISRHPKLDRGRHYAQLGTLGTGNHFIEVCLDERDSVWFMLHSGSRGVGNRIGMHFIELARNDMQRLNMNLPDKDLAYLTEGTEYFSDYVMAVEWAQNYARLNREIMMDHIIQSVQSAEEIPPFTTQSKVINCHHNYVKREHHYGLDVYVTRKGAVRAEEGDMGIIPGSMGARSYIVRGKGNPESFNSCSHGAGRAMSRVAAKKKFTLDDHAKATEGVECRKDARVIDETPAAYKSIDDVMHAQKDLVDIVHTLKQVICVKG